MTRGRKPKPTALKLLAGNPGKRPINAEEPRPPAEHPTKPDHLGPAAAQLWNELAELLVAQKILTKLDGLTLAAVCQLWQRIAAAEAEINTKGLLLKNAQGTVIANPYIGIANAAYKELRVYLSELGMTPAARTRLKVAPPKDASQKSALDQFLARRGKNAS